MDTRDCHFTHKLSHILQYADDTLILGLIKGNDECTAGSWWMKQLLLEETKTKKLMLDFRRIVAPLQPLQIHNTVLEHSDTFGILGLNINDAPGCSENTMTIARRAQQRLCYVRPLKPVGLSRQSLIQAYGGLSESTLTRGITVRFGNTASKERKAFTRQNG